MSGIETVGLVVAAIPLVIEALKSIIFLVRWEAKLEPLIAKLWYYCQLPHISTLEILT